MKDGNVQDAKLYNVKDYLSTGETADVSLAVSSCGSPVVMKRLSKRGTQRILVDNEVKAGRVLEHPGLVRFRDYFQDEINHYIVLDYIHGKDLLAFMEDRDFKPLPEKVARVIFVQMLNAVEYCHSHGVSHKDLKMENVMVDRSMRISLIDFGLCEFISNDQLSDSYVGTPEYVAPEVLQLVPFSPYKADIFTLGEILFCLLTGTLPFDLDQRLSLLRSGIKPEVSFDDLNYLSDLAKDLLGKMLEADPDLRIGLKEVKEHPWTRKSSFTVRHKGWKHKHCKKEILCRLEDCPTSYAC